MVGSIVVVGALTFCTLIPTVWFESCIDEHAQWFIRELLIYKFEQGHKSAEHNRNDSMQKVKVQLVIVQLPDGSRNFTWVARILTIR